MSANGSVAVVTGGAQGIGAAVGRQLSKRGYHIVVLDKNEEAGDSYASALSSEGASVTFIPCDLTQHHQVVEADKIIRSEIGVPSVLANCAGWTILEKFSEQDAEVWRRLIDINFVSVLNTCSVFGQHWVEGSSIVNVASDAARVGVSGQAVYAGAKAAIVAFSKSLAVELARQGVRVNVVSPGSTNTPMLRGMFTEEELAKRVRIIPLGRFGEPEDVASVVTFLAVDAIHVTGQVVSVNGGALRVG
jgi:2-hydroxycyclohexanecarboxyl-CoA dehydrogenase